MRGAPLGAVLSLASTLVLCQGACGPPCGRDRLECGEGGEFVLEPSCELTGPLEVALGQGELSFTELAPGEEPTIHEGTQGGRHFWLGLRVANPALDYPMLQVELAAELVDPAKCGEDPACDPWVSTGKREFVLGPDLRVEGATIEEFGLLLVISIWPDDLERRIRLELLDPCGREGSVEHLVPASTSG